MEMQTLQPRIRRRAVVVALLWILTMIVLLGWVGYLAFARIIGAAG